MKPSNSTIRYVVAEVPSNLATKSIYRVFEAESVAIENGIVFLPGRIKVGTLCGEYASKDEALTEARNLQKIRKVHDD